MVDVTPTEACEATSRNPSFPLQLVPRSSTARRLSRWFLAFRASKVPFDSGVMTMLRATFLQGSRCDGNVERHGS